MSSECPQWFNRLEPMASQAHHISSIFSETHRFVPVFFMLIALLFAGCNREPDREWANENYAEQKAMIDEVQKELQAEFDKFAPIPYQEHPEDPTQRAEFVKAQDARRDAFDQAATAILKKHDKIIGWEISYSFPKVEKPPIPYSFEELSRHLPSWKPSMVRAEKREKLEGGRKISWGEFLLKGEETKSSLGMEVPNYHWGLEVLLPIEKDKATLNTSLFIVPKRADEE